MSKQTPNNYLLSKLLRYFYITETIADDDRVSETHKANLRKNRLEIREEINALLNGDMREYRNVSRPWHQRLLGMIGRDVPSDRYIP